MRLVRLEAIESARANPGGDATLHLFTLSDRFIMALWTKPPMPFVGETGRPSARDGDRSSVDDLSRPTGDRSSVEDRSRVGDRSSVEDRSRVGDSNSAGGSKRGDGIRPDIEPPVLLLRSGSGVGAGLSAPDLGVMPGNWERLGDT